jgi:nickel transport protein
MIKTPLLVLFFLLLAASAAWAHGLFASVVQYPSVVLRFEYSSGEPLAYAEVRIFAPETSDVEYQNGRTDAGGRFAFMPNRSGKWSIACSDGMGHRVHKEIDIDESDRPASDAAAPSGGPPRWLVTLLGISLIANAAGLMRWIKSRGPKDTEPR